MYGNRHCRSHEKTKIEFLQQGILEPIFYGDLVYKFKRIVGTPNFNDQFKKDSKTLYKGWI